MAAQPVLDGRRICPGEPMWQAIPRPPSTRTERNGRLASGADIQWSCRPASRRPDRRQLRPVARPGRVQAPVQRLHRRRVDAGGNCTAVEETYDCGKDVVINDGAVRTELQCDGEIACIGDSSTGGENESNPNFAEAAATLKGAELAALDGACNPQTGECAIFTGQPASCKRVLAGTVDCCQDVQGVSLASYLQLAFTVAALGGAMSTLDPTSPLRGAWEVVSNPVGASWDWIGGQFTSALNGITGSTTPAASSSEALGILGSAQQYLMQETAQWTLDTFGPTAANALFTVNGGAAVAADGTLAAGTVQLGGVAAAVGTALFWVGVAYTAYQVAIILAQIIWACEDESRARGQARAEAVHEPGLLLRDRQHARLHREPPLLLLLRQPVLQDHAGADPAPAGPGLRRCGRPRLLGHQPAGPAGRRLDQGRPRRMDRHAGRQRPAARCREHHRRAAHRQPAGDQQRSTGRRCHRAARRRARTMARTDQVDVPGALSSARDELMPYLQPGAGPQAPAGNRGPGRDPARAAATLAPAQQVDGAARTRAHRSRTDRSRTRRATATGRPVRQEQRPPLGVRCSRRDQSPVLIALANNASVGARRGHPVDIGNASSATIRGARPPRPSSPTRSSARMARSACSASMASARC